jgi:predicted metal-dependent enzyme (double-stranded beta helix superfamily)
MTTIMIITTMTMVTTTLTNTSIITEADAGTSHAEDNVTEPVPPPLKRFIWDIQSIVELAESDREIFVIGRDLMARLVASDDWLPDSFAKPPPSPPPQAGEDRVGAWQFHLYADAMERFCVVSTVLPGGQTLPVCQEPVWEIMGVLRGAVGRQRFALPAGAPPAGNGAAKLLKPGAVETFSPKSGEAVQICNALDHRDSISIHVYGGDIGKLARRAVATDGSVSEFTCGYANPPDWPPYDVLSIQTRIQD